MQGSLGPDVPFTPLLTATIGDVISRPTSDEVKAGYTTVDRQISSYDDSRNQFTFTEYLYSMNLSDADGLKTAPFMVITFTSDGPNLTYHKVYNNGESYTCKLERQ